MEIRELEGIGYHHADSNDDCLLVNRWIKRPEDTTGQSVTVSKLLPKGVRCTHQVDNRGGYGNYLPEKQATVTFKFRIVVEIEKI